MYIHTWIVVIVHIQVPATALEDEVLSWKESDEVVIMLKKQQIFILSRTVSFQLKMNQIVTKGKVVGSDKVEDFALLGSNVILCLTTAGGMKAFRTEEKESEGILVRSTWLVAYICR
jgi:hypothetical protein